ALIEVAVRDVRLVGLCVDENLRDASEAHLIVAASDEARDVALIAAGRRARLAARALLTGLHQELAILGELQDVRVRAAVAAYPDVALVVDENPVVRVGPFVPRARSAPVPQQVAGLIELEYRRRARAAF